MRRSDIVRFFMSAQCVLLATAVLTAGVWSARSSGNEAAPSKLKDSVSLDTTTLANGAGCSAILPIDISTSILEAVVAKPAALPSDAGTVLAKKPGAGGDNGTPPHNPSPRPRRTHC